MPVVRSTRNHDDEFHNLHDQDVGEKSTTSRSPAKSSIRSPRKSIPGDRPLVRPHNSTVNDTRGHPNGHSTPPRPRAPSSNVKRRLAPQDKDIGRPNQQKAVLRYTLTDDGHTHLTQPGDTVPTEYHCNAGPSSGEAHIDAVPEPGSQERFDEDVMVYYHSIEASLVSQFLNLDDDSAWDDQTATIDDTQSPTTPSSTPAGTVTGDTSGWDLEPTSFHLLDMRKFETVTDFDGEEKAVPWPWGDYKYQPATPQTYLDPEEYLAECQLKEIEGMMREELMEAMAQEAIAAGKETKRKQRKEGRKGPVKRVKREDDQPVTGTVAFNNQVVRGRTIYNA